MVRFKLCSIGNLNRRSSCMCCQDNYKCSTYLFVFIHQR